MTRHQCRPALKSRNYELRLISESDNTKGCPSRHKQRFCKACLVGLVCWSHLKRTLKASSKRRNETTTLKCIPSNRSNDSLTFCNRSFTTKQFEQPRVSLGAQAHNIRIYKISSSALSWERRMVVTQMLLCASGGGGWTRGRRPEMARARCGDEHFFRTIAFCIGYKCMDWRVDASTGALKKRGWRCPSLAFLLDCLPLPPFYTLIFYLLSLCFCKSNLSSPKALTSNS